MLYEISYTKNKKELKLKMTRVNPIHFTPLSTAPILIELTLKSKGRTLTSQKNRDG
jgi:hypothetical protein